MATALPSTGTTPPGGLSGELDLIREREYQAGKLVLRPVRLDQGDQKDAVATGAAAWKAPS